SAIEMSHQLRRRLIVHLPEAGHDALGAGVHKPASQSDQALAFDLLAERGLAGAQDHEIGGKSQVEDFAHPQEAVLRFSVFIQERKHEPREFGMFAVDQAVCGEMDDAVPAKLAACDKLAAGLEARGFE